MKGRFHPSVLGFHPQNADFIPFPPTDKFCVNMGNGFNESQKPVVELTNDGEYHIYHIV